MQMPAFPSVLKCCAIAAVVVLAASGCAWAQYLSGGDLVTALRRGGYVLVMRHANSPQTLPDEGAATPGNTRRERQLNENGHQTAKAMGEALRALRIPIGDVLSSPTFRTRETVQDVGLGEAKLFNELGDGTQGYEIASYEGATRFLRARAAEVPRAGTNTIIVTHQPNMESAFGDNVGNADEGEVLVLQPDGRTGMPVGRIKIDEWPRLAAMIR